jgi:hypothetical protein
MKPKPSTLRHNVSQFHTERLNVRKLQPFLRKEECFLLTFPFIEPRPFGLPLTLVAPASGLAWSKSVSMMDTQPIHSCIASGYVPDRD